MHKLSLLFFFLTFCAIPVGAQKDSTAINYDTSPLELKEIDEAYLQRYQDDHAFDYEIVSSEPAWWDDLKTWSLNIIRRIFEGLFGVDKAAGLLAAFFRIVPYLLLCILIFLMIKFFFNVNARASLQTNKEQGSVGLSEEEHLIKNENLQQLVQKALSDKNYKLAIRYYYLFLLKLMGEKEFIVWELQKTNGDYIKEIKNTELQMPFITITRLYDYIWYGDFPIDESKYYSVEKNFSRLQKMLDGHG